MQIYVVVAKENEELLRSKLNPSYYLIKQRMVIGESLIMCIVPKTPSYWPELQQWLEDEGIAYNATVHFDSVSYWPDQVNAMRFDLAGNMTWVTHLGHEPEGLREVLHHLIVTEPNEAREKDRMFHAYMVCIGFNDQERLSKLHRMRKLVGGL